MMKVGWGWVTKSLICSTRSSDPLRVCLFMCVLSVCGATFSNLERD